MSSAPLEVMTSSSDRSLIQPSSPNIDSAMPSSRTQVEVKPGQPTLADLAEQAEQQPLTWLVPSTIVEGGTHIFHGKEESFKTMLVMQMLEVLNIGGQFLDWDLPGGVRVGFAELEMTEKIFRQRARSFMKPAKKKANILVLSADQRRKVLDGKSAEARVRLLVDWVRENGLDVLAVDSLAKLFPPDANIGSQPAVSDVFNQLQKLGCAVILIAHPRKSSQGQPGAGTADNDEIAGSGRFAQDPDIVLKVHRPDKRAPKSVLSWGKNRLDFKPDDLEMFFDAVAFRLYPRHPFLHLLPASREQLIEQGQARFGWKQRRVDEEIAEMKALKDCEGNSVVEEVLQERRAIFRRSSHVSRQELVQSIAVSTTVTGEIATATENGRCES
jgi:hypothetical protein